MISFTQVVHRPGLPTIESRTNVFKQSGLQSYKYKSLGPGAPEYQNSGFQNYATGTLHQ